MKNQVTSNINNVMTVEKANSFFISLAVPFRCCCTACCCRNKGGTFLLH